MKQPIRALTLAATVLLCGTAALAQSKHTLKIGVLNDMSGIYRDLGGPGAVVAAKLAIED